MAFKFKKIQEFKDALQTESKRLKDLSEAEKTAFDQPIFSWQAPLYTEKKRPFWWYVVAAILALALIVYGIWSGAWTLAVAIIVFIGVYYYFQHQEVPIVEILFSEAGVKVGSKIFPYSMFRTFWIDYHPPLIRELHLIPNNNYKYELTLHLNGVKPAQIRNFLTNYLPEWADRQKTFTESVIHLIGL